MYNDDWCNVPSTQVHEVGHNLRLQHAWEEGEGEYKDQSGMMGMSYGSDTTNMCFNPAMSWQLGFYGRRRKTLNFDKDPGFEGRLIGIVDYDASGVDDNLVVVRAVSHNYALGNIFVGFNRRDGMNSDTNDGRDQVTVTRQTDEGTSHLLAELVSGQTHSVTNFKDSSSLHIKVKSINLSVTPAYADIQVYVDNCPPGSSSPDCNACELDSHCIEGDACAIGTCSSGTCSYDTSSCPGTFEMLIATDYYGGETSWELINTCTGSVTAQGGRYPSYTDIKISETIGKDPHKLAVYDSYGDGINSPGYLVAKMDGLEVASLSGDFNFDELFYFGPTNCGGDDTGTGPDTPAPAPATVADQNIVFLGGNPSVELGICQGDCGKLSETPHRANDLKE